MDTKYINVYNNLIKLTTNKNLYKDFSKQDTFSDRLIFFLLHFAFFLKVFKNEKNSAILQEIYDFNFRQLELSIREIGYGDQSINKKMKDYINLFHSIVSEIHFWDDYSKMEKINKITMFFENLAKSDNLVEYFEEFKQDLSKKTLNYYTKGVSKS
ncbi:ubiquinol-cytochrome C chaperone family protein [Candidatus Pelagibacter sp.]|nr:ubiquinol-cytochrome C chaperone family protein [Candidatus Pelagibacter sp.]